MSINSINNQTANITLQKYDNQKVIPIVASTNNQTSFTENHENKKNRNATKSFLIGGGVLTAILGISLDMFGKKLKINQYIPLVLDALGGTMMASSFFIKRTDK